MKTTNLNFEAGMDELGRAITMVTAWTIALFLVTL